MPKTSVPTAGRENELETSCVRLHAVDLSVADCARIMRCSEGEASAKLRICQPASGKAARAARIQSPASLPGGNLSRYS